MIIHALDIGGSSIKHALVDTEQEVGQIAQSFESLPLRSKDFNDLQDQVIEAVSMVYSSDKRVSTVAISTTGGVSEEGVVINAGHFKGYTNISWNSILKSRMRNIKNVFTNNDGKASTWAEYLGASQPKIHVHYVIGTGIGGATIVRGEFLIGSNGSTGHLGHIKVTNSETPRCSCGNYGCVETVAAGPAIVRYFHENRSKHKLQDGFSLQEIFAAAQSGDPLAKNAIDVAGEYLGIALSNVMNILNPDIITIGGGVVLASNQGDGDDGKNLFIQAIIRSAQKRAHKRAVEAAEIRSSRFGNNGGLIGTAFLAHSSKT